MPEFVQNDEKPIDSINVQFETVEDREAFLKVLGYSPGRRKSLWYPKREYLQQSERGDGPVKAERNRYPVYVPTKGRWESRHTIKTLEKLGIRYKAVVEKQERASYAEVIDPKRILVLPHRDKGLVETRNWIWDHAEESGAERFWTFDDNIDGFYRMNRNLKRRMVRENPLVPIEEFADRYENVVIAGMHYEFFLDRRSVHPPYHLNTRVYSNMLIQTNARDPSGKPYRNEGFYNDDTDLCLRVLKDGFCTVLFNAFLIKKMPTMTVKGGMTGHYQGDGRKKMAEELQKKHPDVVTVTRKWGRWQHHVDYKRFRRNALKKKRS